MNQNEQGIMGKDIKDMYGSYVGRAVGTTTDIDGTVITVGVDCGYRGLMEISFEHLVVQEDAIVYVPQWRLDSQKILREKGLIIRRLRALHTILAENGRMKEDSESVRRGYDQKLSAINESEYTVRETLAARMAEIAEQMKAAKALRFDATIQYKSNEIAESDYKIAKAGTDEILERIEYEMGEIRNMQGRLEELASEESQIYDSAPQTEEPIVEESPVAEPEATLPDPVAEQAAEPVSIPPEVPADPPAPQYSIPEPPTEPPKSDWLARMTSQ